MSFATGLFSFMGGMSRQYREELSAEKAALATQVKADAEHEKWLTETALEREKFESGEEQFLTSQAFLEKQEKSRKLEKRGDILFERQQFKEETKQTKIEHELDVNKFNESGIQWWAEFDEKKRAIGVKETDLINRFDLDKDIFALNEKKVDIQVEQYAEKMNISKEDLELQRDKLTEIVRHNMKTEYIDEMEAMLEAEEGITTYKSIDGESNIKIKRIGASKEERVMTAMASLSALTNEDIEKLTPEAYIELKKDITADLALLVLESYNPKRESTIDFSREFGEAFKLDIVNESFGDALSKLKEKKKKENNDNGIKSDDIRIINDGKGKLSLVNVEYEKYAKLAGFDTVERFKASAQTLITHQNTSEYTTGNLSPFRDMNALISTFESERIDFKMLQLAPELDYLQELPMDSSVNPDYYTNLISKTEELGLVQPNGEGLEQLFNFIYKVQPILENIGTDRSVKLARTPKEAGRDIDIKAAESQYFAANTAVRTLDELVLTIKDLPSEDLLGTAMSVAALYERVVGTVRGLKTLISKVENTPIAKVGEGGLTQSGKNALLSGLNKISLTESLTLTGELAEKNAKMEYLKFSLAYQMSMALQGGTGGRTISDQDVENMLRALNMNHLFNMNDEKQVLSSLATIRTFMTGISAKAYYQQLGDTKGYRTTAHVIGILNAINMNKLANLATEMEDKFGFVTAQLDEAAIFQPSNYNKTWSIRKATNNGTPIYVELENGVKITGSEQYIPSNIYNQMVQQIDGIKQDSYTIINYDIENKPMLGSTPVFKTLGQE